MSENKYWSTRLYGIDSVFLLIKMKTIVPTWQGYYTNLGKVPVVWPIIHA